MHIQAGTVIGGIDALEPAVAAHFHQPPDVGQVLVAEEQLRRGAVEAEDEDLHDRSELSFHGRALGDAQRGQDRRGQVQQPRPSPRNGRFMNSTPGTWSGSMI